MWNFKNLFGQKTTGPEQQDVNLGVPATAPASPEDNIHIFVLIAAALAAYGVRPAEIAVIRPIGGRAWVQAGRYESVHHRRQMF